MRSFTTLITSVQTSYAKALRKTTDEASFRNHEFDEVFLCLPLCRIVSITHLFTYITLQSKSVDQVVGLVVIDDPRPTGRTPEKASSGSSSSDRAVMSSPA